VRAFHAREAEAARTAAARAPSPAGRAYFALGPARLHAAVFFAPDGTLHGLRVRGPRTRSDTGRWWRAENGRLCRAWRSWDTGRTRCVPGDWPATAPTWTRGALISGMPKTAGWRTDVPIGDGRPGQPGAERDVHGAWAGGVPAIRRAAAGPAAAAAGWSEAAHWPSAADLLAKARSTQNAGPREIVGYLASALVLATFCMREMRALRVLAIASNLAFIAYSLLAVLPPVFLLHAILLPVNAVRLLQTRDRAGTPAVR
jgi:hypothetical protein